MNANEKGETLFIMYNVIVNMLIYRLEIIITYQAILQTRGLRESLAAVY